MPTVIIVYDKCLHTKMWGYFTLRYTDKNVANAYMVANESPNYKVWII